jgi:hypothetical protein
MKQLGWRPDDYGTHMLHPHTKKDIAQGASQYHHQNHQEGLQAKRFVCRLRVKSFAESVFEHDSIV